MIKVFLGGEGANELGTRGQRPPGDDPGVIETLLRRVRPDGWRVEGAIVWKEIRKYQAGAAAHYPAHGETYNVLRLLLLAYERDCKMVVFLRDVDGDEGRQDVTNQSLQSPAARQFVARRSWSRHRAARPRAGPPRRAQPKARGSPSGQARSAVARGAHRW